MAKNKKDEKAKAKYFCENCSYEVKANARFCPNCGKFFSSVRCPKCKTIGTVKDFKNGCPNCHYSMTSEELYGSSSESSDGLKHRLSFKSKRKIKQAFKNREKSSTPFESEMPLWLFIVSFAVILILVAVLVGKCQ